MMRPFSAFFFAFFGTLFGLVLLTGCSWSRVSVPLSPSRILSSERSRQGLVAMEKGDFDEAEKRLSDAVRLDKSDTDHRRFYAEVLWQQGKQEAALQHLNAAVNRGDKNEPILHLLLAEKYHEIQDHQTAFRHAEKAVQLNPAEARGWGLLAKTRRLLTEERAANSEHRTAEMENENAVMFRQSRDEILRAMTLAPESRDYLPELAVIQMRCGQFEQALAAWLDLQNNYPKGKEPTEILAGKGETLAALHRYEEAAVCLYGMIQREPENTAAKQRLNEILAASQQRIQR